MEKLDIKAGDKFGKLTVKSEYRKRLPSGQTNRVMVCICDCGNTKDVRLVHLSRGRTVSCGCVAKSRNGQGGSLLCKVWRQMNRRCGVNDKKSKIYHDKGITVCPEWKLDFESFRIWSLSNGYKIGLQIDRIDNAKGYSPENCRWVTPQVNCNNRDVTMYVNYKGSKVSIQLLLKKLNLSNHYNAIRDRILRGWDHDKAIDTPIRKGNYRKPKLIKELNP